MEFLKKFRNRVERENAPIKPSDPEDPNKTREPHPVLDESAILKKGWLGAMRDAEGMYVPEFREWFGKSIVTTDRKPGGEPAVMYHFWRPPHPSEVAEFTAIFDVEKTQFGLHLGTAKAAAYRSKVGRNQYMTASPSLPLGQTLPLVVRLESPLYIPDLGAFTVKRKYDSRPDIMRYVMLDRKHRNLTLPAQDSLDKVKTIKDLHQWLQSLGYDGIIYRNLVEGYSESKVANSDSVIVLDPSKQLRSAITGQPIIAADGTLLFNIGHNIENESDLQQAA